MVLAAPLEIQPPSSYNARPGVKESRVDLAEQTIGIAGVGLIGGSIAVALRERGFGGRLVGITRDPSRLGAEPHATALDEISNDLAQTVEQCSLLVFCTPVDAIIEGIRSIADRVQPRTLLTDVGSAKTTICNTVTPLVPQHAAFVGSHPLAGSEKQGFRHADADLFRERCCVITPTSQSTAQSLDRLTAFWQFLGAQVLTMTPEAHDLALAETSHLPHVAAAALASQLDESRFPLTASGFRDTTRIAAGDPEIWSAILKQNASATVACLDRYIQSLGKFREALHAQHTDRLKILLEAAKRNRDALH
ncbi:MAG: prephenate dehydrogenase/arogenate dehydrogenase family protein [Planctomycetaceae bacterium]